MIANVFIVPSTKSWPLAAAKSVKVFSGRIRHPSPSVGQGDCGPPSSLVMASSPCHVTGDDGVGHRRSLGFAVLLFTSPRERLHRGIRSRAEGDKRKIPENRGERQEGQHFVGTTRKRPGGDSSTGFSLSRGEQLAK